MNTLLVVVFVLAYAAIALEHQFKVNKGAPALIGAGLLWTIYAVFTGDVSGQLNESLSATAQIVFFLMGAMTIVEVVDAHDGFEVITARIKTAKMTTLLWLIGFVTFFLSAVLDNLTTTIVMLSLTRKLLGQKEDRLFFAGIIVIAANAGGAWSPIGDVTTTMLWIGGQITALAIIKGVFIPSLINMLTPLTVVSFMLRGKTFASIASNTFGSGAVVSRVFYKTTPIAGAPGAISAANGWTQFGTANNNVVANTLNQLMSGLIFIHAESVTTPVSLKIFSAISASCRPANKWPAGLALALITIG